MSKQRRDTSKLPKDVTVGETEGTFGVCLGELLGKKTSQKEHCENAEVTKESKKQDTQKLTRWSCQRQTAGRGGKVVTLIVFPKDARADLEAVAKQMRRALGCGSHVEENKIVLQGDISDRANAWLEKNR